MKSYIFSLLILITGLGAELNAQNCADTTYGNVDGRFFLMTYANQAERDAALLNINSITINGITYAVSAHPTGDKTIRTTVARPFNTFSDPFTGVVTLNPSGETCEYTASALPISLTYFKAIMESSSIVIKWETAQEINNEGFELQKSTDGLNFETLTWVDAAGSPYRSQYYEVEDTDYSKGNNYYRFKQIDQNGAFEYSNIVSVNIETKNSIRLKTNILSQGQDLILLGADNVAFEIYNNAGNRLTSGFITRQSQEISTSGFLTGMYFIRTEDGKTIKFIVN